MCGSLGSLQVLKQPSSLSISWSLHVSAWLELGPRTQSPNLVRHRAILGELQQSHGAGECARVKKLPRLRWPPFCGKLSECLRLRLKRRHSESKDLASAALGQAMAATICLSWCVTFFGYIFLHISYPSHMRNLNAQKAQKAEAEAAEEAR